MKCVVERAASLLRFIVPTLRSGLRGGDPPYVDS